MNEVLLGEKQCRQCKLFKPRSHFGKRHKSPSGLKSECKKCMCIRQQDRRRLKGRPEREVGRAPEPPPITNPKISLSSKERWGE